MGILNETMELLFGDMQGKKLPPKEQLADELAIKTLSLQQSIKLPEGEYSVSDVKDRMADVIIATQNLLEKYGFNEDELVRAKLGIYEDNTTDNHLIYDGDESDKPSSLGVKIIGIIMDKGEMTSMSIMDNLPDFINPSDVTWTLKALVKNEYLVFQSCGLYSITSKAEKYYNENERTRCTMYQLEQ